MNIPELSVALSTNQLQSQVSTAVLSKAMDVEETMGQGLIQMIDAAAMEQSVNPNVGSNMDLRI